MGANSKIAWTHHTFNPWWGCVRVSPGCEHCYAETFSKRVGLKVWGAQAPRRFFGDKHWAEPIAWNRKAEQAGARRRVFCASMADVFEVAKDPEVHRQLVDARGRLFQLIEKTPHLDWLLLTKRPENIAALVPWGGELGPWPTNVWLGTTTEDQQRYDERWPIIAKIPASVRFLSHEPGLGPLRIHGDVVPNWVITGGESGPKARPYNLQWALSVVTQCRALGITPFVKQLGAYVFNEGRGLLDDEDPDAVDIVRVRLKAAKGDDLDEWPINLRVQEFPTPELDEAPYVCPGCHAVGGERCAPGCVDDEIRRERDEALERGDYDRVSDDEDDEPREVP